MVSKTILLLTLLFMFTSAATANAQSKWYINGRECKANDPQDKAFLKAVDAGNLILVKRLLRAGASPNTKDDCDISAITRAARNGNVEIVKVLIDAGADVNAIDEFWSEPVLKWVINDYTKEDGYEKGENISREKIYRIVELLIKAGADLNEKGRSNQPALMLAIDNRLDNVAELLIAAGADVNAKNDDDETAYSHAAIIGNKHIKKLLADAGADITIGLKDYKENYGENAFIQAAAEGRTDILEAMLADGTDPNYTNQAGVTALMRVVNDSSLDLLLAAHADVNKVDNAGFTALIWAVFYNRPEHVKKLLAEGADANATTREGKTALYYANDKPLIKTLLIRAGAKR